MSATRLTGERDPGHGPAEQKIRLRWLAWFAAVLLHLAVPAALLAPALFGGSATRPAAAPAGIPVTLVMLPEKPEPKKPEPKKPDAKKPEPAKPEAVPRYRESGPDATTAGPPPPPPAPPEEAPKPAPPAPPVEAEAPAAPKQPPADQLAIREAAPAPAPPPAEPPEPQPEPPKTPLPEVTLPPAEVPEILPLPPPAKPPPAARPSDTRAPGAAPLPEAKPKETVAPAAKPATPSRQPAKTAAARPQPRPAPANRAPAETESAGDSYLNRTVDEIKKHGFYPKLAFPLNLTGIAVFEIAIDRDGKLLGIELLKSTGSELLDRAGVSIIRETAPFPAPPPDMPGDRIILTLQIPFTPDEPRKR